MSKLLKLKHWQLFLLLIGLPLVFQIFTMQAMMNNEPAGMFISFPLMMILVVAIYFGWFYALGTNLHKKLPSSVSMNLKRFKIFLIIPMVYIVLISLFMTFAMSDVFPEYISSYMMIIIPLHLFSIFCMFYCLYFISKELKSVEWQRPVTFNDYAGEFFFIWFFPFGIWFIQPRINKLFSENA